MGRGDKHQKKDVEAALKRAEAAGLKVTHDRNRHRWGWLICCPCSGRQEVSCTPKSAGGEAKRIDGFINKHRGCA
ncbi:hypothetical protein [Streptomyces clavuligerus]|nr:hypothetical protein [Streptomyces clavuligerus]AXU13990.1 hypothetical protein D1794_15365 [Streptomyces clavuligerus]EDY51248.1 hypothetical protein SSCG_04228 [Streptomyces clavuligerus]QCS06763.1 hypothetical protein CRV15_14720 [Streptomyces clavuligerus]WDN52748.1 hypothetical protein LL058_13290 [Streptomyces clavuligerus]